MLNNLMDAVASRRRCRLLRTGLCFVQIGVHFRNRMQGFVENTEGGST